MAKKTVRFEVSDLLPIGLTLIVAGIGIAYGLSVVSDMGEDFCDSSSGEYLSGNVCYQCPNASHSSFIAAGICSNQSQGEGMANVTALNNGGADFNGTVNAIEGISKIPKKMPLIATVIVAAVIIGILIRYLMVKYQ